MRRAMPILLALLAPLCMTDAWGEENSTLRVDGKAVALPAGLQPGADGRVWITAGDLRAALDVIVKRVIPKPPTGRRPDKRRERDGWLVCGRGVCDRYRGKAEGSFTEPSFELARVAKLLGMRHRVKGGVHELHSPARPPTSDTGHARLDRLAPDLRLERLGGAPLRLRDLRGHRMLLVTWATWSATREQVEAWRLAIQTRAQEGVKLVLVALEAEGDEHVRDFVALDRAAHEIVAIDRHAEMPRRFPMTDVGRWWYVDELGIVRAEGTRPDSDALAWIDLLLAEEATPRARPAPAAATLGPSLTVLRERADAEPEAIAPTLALLDALGDEHAAERITRARALVAAHPKQAWLAFRLAALLLAAGKHGEAVAALDEARRRTPRAWYLRRQYWALWEPNRYYDGAIDTAWERQQRREDEKAFGRPQRR